MKWQGTITQNQMCIRDRVIIDYHIRYGHMEALKVIQALDENWKIKNINRKVRNYLKSCNIYQCVKISNEKKEGIMIPITSNAKLEKVFLDICGQFPDVYKRQILYITAEVEGIPAKIMIDTGTNISIINANELERIQRECCLLYTSRCV